MADSVLQVLKLRIANFDLGRNVANLKSSARARMLLRAREELIALRIFLQALRPNLLDLIDVFALLSHQFA